MILFSGKLMFVSFLMLVVTMIETLAYATRISGVRVKLMATAISLFSTMVIVSRFSTMIQQPLTAKLLSDAPKDGKLVFVENEYRLLLVAVSIGVLLGIALFPTFIGVFSRAIIQLSRERGSMAALIIKWVNWKGIKTAFHYIRLPRFIQSVYLRRFMPHYSFRLKMDRQPSHHPGLLMELLPFY